MKPGGRAAIAVSSGILLAHLASVVLLGPTPAGSLVGNTTQVVAALTAAAASIAAQRRAAGIARRFWSLVAAGFCIWGAAQASYVYYENWLHVAVPIPSWTHLLFRAYGAPLLMILLLEPEDRAERLDWLHVLDLAQVGILFLFFYFDLYFVPGGPWQSIALPTIGGFLDLSDAENWLLAVAFLLRARLARREEERALAGRLAPYLVAYALSSSFANYAYYYLGPHAGSWHDLPWTASLGLGAVLASTWREGEKDAAALEPHPTSGVQWAPAAIPLLVLALALQVARQELTVAFIAVFASVSCFAARLLITQYRRQAAMLALRVSEKRYKDLVRLAPDAILVYADGKITFANPAAARALSAETPEWLVGKELLDFAPPEQRAELAELLRDLTDETAHRELTAMRTDGNRVVLEAVGMPFAPDETLDGAVLARSRTPARLIVARDVTERKQVEAEREALIRELEAKNAELERFTYTVSHDLKSPLITVRGYLGYVEQDAASGNLARLKEDIERISNATIKMQRLLEELLELSRVGRVANSPEAVPFGEVVREAGGLVAGQIAARGVRVEIQDELPAVWGDRPRLVEVLQNLIDNAVKFMGDQAQPRVEVGARRDGQRTVLYVRDNGIGIDALYHEKVFGLFDKLDAKSDGTGVGLALVKRIVEVHGGRIWVESEGAGTGAAFCFTLAERATASGPAPG
jgi:PAS domain S-box-containing protein